jgi:hypothetical protein
MCIRALRTTKILCSRGMISEKWCPVFGQGSCAPKEGASAERARKIRGPCVRGTAARLAIDALCLPALHLRRLPRRANARTQRRPRFTWMRGRTRYPRHHSRVSGPPRAPAILPAGTMPDRPGAGLQAPRGGTASVNGNATPAPAFAAAVITASCRRPRRIGASVRGRDQAPGRSAADESAQHVGNPRADGAGNGGAIDRGAGAGRRP